MSVHSKLSIFKYRFRSMTAPELQPSNHVMKDWPMVHRLSGLIERVCEHRVGHPDPDSVVWLESNGPEQRHGTWGVHGCCWEWCCCQPDGKVANR